MNCCKPEQVGTKEHSKMLKRIRVFEDGRIAAKEARNWKIEGQNSWVTRKEYRRLWNGLMAQKGLRNVAREKCCRTEVLCQRKKETLLESTRPCMNRISEAVD